MKKSLKYTLAAIGCVGVFFTALNTGGAFLNVSVLALIAGAAFASSADFWRKNEFAQSPKNKGQMYFWPQTQNEDDV